MGCDEGGCEDMVVSGFGNSERFVALGRTGITLYVTDAYLCCTQSSCEQPAAYLNYKFRR